MAPNATLVERWKAEEDVATGLSAVRRFLSEDIIFAINMFRLQWGLFAVLAKMDAYGPWADYYREAVEAPLAPPAERIPPVGQLVEPAAPPPRMSNAA